MKGPYEALPESVGIIDVDLPGGTSELEMMCYLYQPIKVPGTYAWANYLEPRLKPFYDMILMAENHETIRGGDCKQALRTLDESYYYLTVKNLFVTKDNVANRPGWHTDGFGGDDVNYTWCDKFPTIFSRSKFTDIDPDHAVSMHQFDMQAKPNDDYELPEKMLTRLDPFVVHRTPKVVREGMRTFFKLSISKHPYNLKGNSKNPLLPDLNWKEYDRSGVRNDPVYHGKDYYPISSSSK